MVRKLLGVAFVAMLALSSAALAATVLDLKDDKNTELTGIAGTTPNWAYSSDGSMASENVAIETKTDADGVLVIGNYDETNTTTNAITNWGLTGGITYTTAGTVVINSTGADWDQATTITADTLTAATGGTLALGDSASGASNVLTVTAVAADALGATSGTFAINIGSNSELKINDADAITLGANGGGTVNIAFTGDEAGTVTLQTAGIVLANGAITGSGNFTGGLVKLDSGAGAASAAAITLGDNDAQSYDTGLDVTKGTIAVQGTGPFNDNTVAPSLTVTGGLTLTADSDVSVGKGIISVDSLNSTAGKIAVNEDGIFKLTSATATDLDGTNVTLAGGLLDISAATMDLDADDEIEGYGDVLVKAATGDTPDLTITKAGNIQANENGEALSIYTNLGDSGADPVVPPTYANVATNVAGGAEISSDGILNVGDLTIMNTQGITGDSDTPATAADGVLNVKGDLQVSAGTAGAVTYVASGTLTTTVTGKTTIDAAQSYLVTGSGNNDFQGGVVVAGSFGTATPGNAAADAKVGGTIEVKSTGTLVGGNSDTNKFSLVKSGSDTPIITFNDANGAKVQGYFDASVADAQVSKNVALGDTTAGVFTVGSLAQTGGTISNAGTNTATALKVVNAATVTGASDSARSIISVNSTFEKGVTFGDFSQFNTADGADTITLGTAAAGANLTLDGGWLNAGTTYPMTIQNATGNTTAGSSKVVVADSDISSTMSGTINAGNVNLDVKGDLIVTLPGDKTFNKYTQTAGTVTNLINSAGALTFNDLASVSGSDSVFAANAKIDDGMTFKDGATLLGVGQTITGNNVDSVFSVDSTSFVDLDGDNVTLKDIPAASIDGTINVGVKGLANTQIMADNTDLTLNEAYITFNKDAADLFAANPADFVVIDNTNGGTVTGTLKYDGVMENGVLGSYILDIDNNQVVGEVKRAAAQDADEVRDQLEDMYNTPISDGTADMIWDYVADPTQLDLTQGTPEQQAGWENALGFISGKDGRYGQMVLDGKGKQAEYIGNVFFGGSHSGVVTTGHTTANQFGVQNMYRTRDVRMEGYQYNAYTTDNSYGSLILNRNDFGNRIWAGAFGLWEDADAKKNDAGYKYKSHGFITGYDRVFGPMVVGASFAYTKGDYEDKFALRSDSDIESYSFGLYASYNHCSGFFTNIFGGYTYSDNDIRETYDILGTARGDYHTNTWQAGIEFGYDIRPTANFTITPSIGVNYIHSKASSFMQRYSTAIDQRIRDLKQDSAYLPIKVVANYDIAINCDSRLNLNANAGYTYAFSDSGVTGTLDYMIPGVGGYNERINGRKAGRHLVNVGAGARLYVKNFDIGVNYDYYTRSNYDAHRVLGTVGLSF